MEYYGYIERISFINKVKTINKIVLSASNAKIVKHQLVICYNVRQKRVVVNLSLFLIVKNNITNVKHQLVKYVLLPPNLLIYSFLKELMEVKHIKKSLSSKSQVRTIQIIP